MTQSVVQHEPPFTVVGDGEPSDKLLETLADLLLAAVDAEELTDATPADAAERKWLENGRT